MKQGNLSEKTRSKQELFLIRKKNRRWFEEKQETTEK